MDALASRHHLSDYNRAKFGPQGSPVLYAPLDPDRLRRLRDRQRADDDRPRWWPCPPTPLTSPSHPIKSVVHAHPISISQIIPPPSLPAIASQLSLSKQPSPVLFRHSLPTYPLHPFSLPSHLPPFLPISLGNLLLSSCPGKKVRLTGPVRGRNAVCRDLHLDLRRIRLLGARCIVCCLDDDELERLIGLPWSEYCQLAHRERLDVLRIPLPQGLAPLSPSSLDADLLHIIERYSLQGMSVLVHCRGGIGRAGLFACCWMIRLGLCGWIDSAACHSNPVVRPDTLQLVERAIEVVRRRRSIKAIETLEQVQFLVDYVDYLRTCDTHTNT